MAMTTQDILWEDGRPNMGGLQTRCWYGFARDVQTWPVVQAWDEASNFTQLVTLGNQMYMKNGKQCHELYLTMDTGELKASNVGEIDGKSFEPGFELFHPGTRAEMLGFAQWINNSNLFFFVLDTESIVYMVGNQMFPAKVETSEITSGKLTKDRRGWKLMVKSRGISPMYVYPDSFTIPTTPSAS